MNQNQLKKLSSLAESKYRKKHMLFLAEGVHIVKELLNSNWEAELLVVTHKAAESGELASILEAASRKGIPVEIVARKDFFRIATTETPQEILAAAKLPSPRLGELLSQKRILIADGVSDPGNLGTMIRSAAAFGFGGFVTTPGSADIFGPKAVRATQGALFQLVTANHVGAQEIVEELKATHKIYALSANGKNDLREARTAHKLALVVGAEIAGVGREFLEAASQVLRIPISGRIESLNAAVAAGIAMYELGRRE